MLTPRFKLHQDDNNVYVTVHAPYTNIGDTEIDVDGENFLFVSSPYFLRLRLPGKIIDNEQAKGSYSCDSGDFNLTFAKENPGEHFPNLDMITSLLAPRDIPDINPSLVELLEEDGITLEDNANEHVDHSNNFRFGFANKITTEFQDIGSEFPQIFELKVPESVSLKDRHELRMKHEYGKFSTDHYLADLYDGELLAPYLSTVQFWKELDEKAIEFTEEEVGVLKELPNKHYLLSKTEFKEVMCGLVDILYAYCYDKRTTLNENTVESSWTVNKLSSILSWFCVFDDTKQVLIACYRRALTYPIFRNFDLCNKVRDDLISLFGKGKKFVIKCMIDIHQSFNTSNDARYILNQLYIRDYLVFLQKCTSEEIEEVCHNIVNVELTKNDLDLELEELEAAAEMVQKEEIEIMENEMALKMASMALIPGLNMGSIAETSTDDSDTSSSSSDSSSNSSDYSSDELDSDDDPS